MIVVAGVGNELLGDDGFGPVVARALASLDLGPGVIVRDVGLRGRDLAFDVAEGVDVLIVVDLVDIRAEPGTVVIVDPDIRPGVSATGATHGLDVGEVVALARRIGRGPRRVRVVGCPPVDCSPGRALSPVVADAVGRTGTIVADLVGRLRREATCSDA